MTKIRITAIVILLASIALGFFVFSAQKPFKLGLDLSGGTLLTYKADVSEIADNDVSDAMSSLRDVIERRVNLFGVSEPLVQTEKSSRLAEEENRLIVELPGVTDVQEAVKQLGETPLLEFKLLNSSVLAHGQSSSTPDLYTSTGLTGRFLNGARIQFDNGGGRNAGGLVNQPVVVLEFNKEGSDLFASITKENIGEILAIFLDGEVISRPVIQSEITGGTAVITGTFTPQEARNLARNLNFGALPVPIELIGTQTVGASIGNKVLAGGITAGIWGIGIVILFLIFWYRLPGLFASISLIIYVIIVLALFKLIPVTLTAAGIAGFILSVGMAVDANVLIFERLKEELKSGKELEEAIKEGFSRAWLSIRDSNLSTLITAVVLFWFGTSIVEGFALTLGIGILVSMITAISITRTILLSFSKTKKLTLFGVGFAKLK